ncbi:hypothetical protein IJ182_00745 [bacterium]|nr:hypothetical protein [bacterium]
MINRLRNMLSQVLYTSNTTGVKQTSTASLNKSMNSYENPFIQVTQGKNYGINKPVKGGYFAGYYNGQPNIVGRRLFIEA